MKSLVIFICLFPFSLIGQQPKLMLPVGHTDKINTAFFSPDGKKIATASFDKTTKIWDSKTGVLLADLKGHTDCVGSAIFSPNGKKVVTSSWDGVAKVWNSENGKLIADLTGHSGTVLSSNFSPDGKKIVTTSYGTVKIWDSESGALHTNLKGEIQGLYSAVYFPDGKKIATNCSRSSTKIWDSETGDLLIELKLHNTGILPVVMSPDGKKILTSSDSTGKIWDTKTGRLLTTLNGHANLYTSAAYSLDGKKLVTASYDRTVKVWDSETGVLLADFKEHSDAVLSVMFSPDGKKIISSSDDNTAKIWDSVAGQLLVEIKGHRGSVRSAAFSFDGSTVVTSSWDATAKIWSAETGFLIRALEGNTLKVASAVFSPDGGKIAAVTTNGQVKLWNTLTGTSNVFIRGHSGSVNSIVFSPDGTKIATASSDMTGKIWDSKTGTLLVTLKGHEGSINSSAFSPDGKKIITSSWDKTAKVWDVETGAMLADLTEHHDPVLSAAFSADGTKVITTVLDNNPQIWDLQKRKVLFELENTIDEGSAIFSPDGLKILTIAELDHPRIWSAETGMLTAMLQRFGESLNDYKGTSNVAFFTPDGRKIITANHNGTVKYWDSETGVFDTSIFLGGNYSLKDVHFSSQIAIAVNNSEIALIDLKTGNNLRKLVVIDNENYLTYDDYGRYDGSDAARKLLYFICDDEVISLDQVKDQLWVPNLSERIMKGEIIYAPKLSELNICGRTPSIEMKDSSNGYRFIIAPGSGGLGETVLYINGIEVKRYNPSELSRKQSTYELQIGDQSLQPYLIYGKENTVTVKSFTQKNDIASRGATSIRRPESKDDIAPNLYAIMVGVSDYKGEELDLKYAAKDASDLSNAVAASARKLLNRDGSEHVFMYNLTTGENRTKFPEKEAIKQVFDEIGKKATSKDILLIFFAGHGVMEGEKKQFYFLTADASKNSDITTSGISIAELNEWMKPQQIKAQKRVLIFDACNSGQAINDLVTIGNTDDQYIAARNDDETNRIKAVEKLNERSGMFILSASASNQSAYEMGRYSQGLLTYALLKAIREDPAILEDGKLLNVDKWFVKAEKTVTDMVSGMENRQQPQKFGTGGFNIGEVDKEIISGIALAQEKPLFGGSLFLNPIAGDDDIDLTQKVNEQLNSLSIRGEESKISFIASTNDPSAYKLTGTYEISGDNLKVNINIKQKEFKYRFEVTGVVKDLASVAEEIVKKAEEYIQRR